MTTKQELLPDDLLWAGHASDVVLTALADGQNDIVPARLRAHVETCPTCSAHLGHAALLSLHAGEELQRVREATPERLPLPRAAIALGLAAAVLGLLPSILSGSAASFATRTAPMVARTLGLVLRRLPDEASLVLTYGGSLLLVAMGFALVRLLPKKEVSR
jgi:hypothetical protein